MHQHYHHWLVLVSLLVAILASYTALTLALRIRVADRYRMPAWLIGGGVAMGIGIWSMHFVGMLAMRLPIEISYDVRITVLSMVIAIVVSTFALHIASRHEVGRAALVGAGIAMGTGICAMHYVGMAAIVITPAIRYDATWVAISYAISIAASFAALGIAFAPRIRAGWRRYNRALGAIGMGLAIAGMHYAGMAAARFPEAAVSAAAQVNKGWLAGSVTTITLFVLVSALAMSFLESRATARAARFRASLAHAAETSRAKDEFLAMLGHELRNPLASISNAVHLLQRAGPDSANRQFAEDVIARQALHLTRIVDDLLDVGRAIAGKISLHRDTLDVQAAVAETLRALAAAGITTDRRVGFDGTVAWVNADRTRIVQVVSNLVSNAVQHTVPGGRIDVRLSTRDDAVELSVSDDGTGMDTDTVARVFDLFFQAHQGPERRRGGLGLGLTLARRIIELHGGTIDATSAGLGKGATFTILLPAASPLATAGAPAPPAFADARRVVVVEDSDDARLSLQKVLEQHGHTVYTAADGPGGLDVIARLRPDVAFIDIGLPGLDGYALAKRVRATGLRTQLVALTGYGLAEDRTQALAAGFDAHLTKPPSLERLLALVAASREAHAPDPAMMTGSLPGLS
jgi:diguanylate cyclase